MSSLSLSDKYAIAAALGLLLLVLFDNALLMLIVSVAGLIGGIWILRRGQPRRVAYIAAAGFAITLALAVFTLVR